MKLIATQGTRICARSVTLSNVNAGHRLRLRNAYFTVQDALNRAPALLILPLFGAALCVLVIGCANAAALQLARGLRRYPEMAVHAALGASRARLAGQALIEHLIVGLLGGLAGTGLAYLALSALTASGSPTSIPRLDAVVLDMRLLAFGIALGVMSGVLSGLPALMRLLGGADLSGVDRAHHSRVTSGGWRTLQTLTAAQIALTLALLASAGLLLRSMQNAANVTAGYQTRQILTMMVTDVGSDWRHFTGARSNVSIRSPAWPAPRSRGAFH